MTEVDMSDFQKILDSRPLIGEKTKTSYLSTYKKLTRELAKPIRNSTQKQILETIDELSDKLTTRNVLINMAIIVFQLYEKDTGLLLKRREKNSLNNKRVRIETNHAKLKYLPGRQKLLNHLEDTHAPHYHLVVDSIFTHQSLISLTCIGEKKIHTCT